MSVSEEKSVKNIFRFFLNVYFLLREREREKDRVQAGKRQRERETQNLKQAPGSEQSTQSLTQGLNPPTMRS